MLSVTTKLSNGESEHKLTHTLEFYESFTQVLLLSAFKNLTSVDEVPFIRFLPNAGLFHPPTALEQNLCVEQSLFIMKLWLRMLVYNN